MKEAAMKAFDNLKDRHRQFIADQHMFFVATAPLAPDGHVNLSPKGLDSFAILAADRVAYIDLGGSGIETHAHLRENGRICLMFCAFDAKPLILRLYGRGTPHQFGSRGFEALRDQFPAIEVPVRGIMEIDITRVQDSCGWAVPLYRYEGDRSRLLEHNAERTQDAFTARRVETNATSIDGLEGLEG
jgi:hypothetical protein